MWQIHRLGRQNYLYAPGRKILVDCGPGKDQAKKLKKAVEDIDIVFLTHAHADHYGGAPYLLEAFPHLLLLTFPQEISFLRNPVLEPALLFGGMPPQALSTPFLLGPVDLPFGEIDPLQFPEIEFVPLPGDTPGLSGIAMGEILFTSDAVFGLEILEKYPILYHFDPEGAFHTLKHIADRFATFLPTHGSQGGKELAFQNIVAIERVFDFLLDTVNRGTVLLEKVLTTAMGSLSPAKTMDHYFLNRSALLGYVSALERCREITIALEDMEVVVHRF